MAEQGFPGADLDIWFGMWAPKGTPEAVIRRMDAAVAQALAHPDLARRYADLGAETVPLATLAFKAKLQQEAQLLGTLIAQQKIRAE